MITLADREALCAALSPRVPADLEAIIADIVRHAERGGVLDLTYVAVIERGDREEDIAQALGFSPLVEPIEGVRYGEPGFEPYWAFLRRVGGWYELTHVVGTGFAYILLISTGCESELTTMCRDHLMVPL